jgi:hypothetical protein
VTGVEVQQVGNLTVTWIHHEIQKVLALYLLENLIIQCNKVAVRLIFGLRLYLIVIQLALLQKITKNNLHGHGI